MNLLKVSTKPFSALLEQPAHELALRLTLLAFIMHGSSNKWLDVPLIILCGYLLLAPAQLKNSAIWITIAILMWCINATDWLWIDNHKYLMSYWVLACAIGVTAENPGRVLAWNGRVILGLCFACATLWKILGGQYTNGEFLYYTLLVDSRMDELATTLGGMHRADLAMAGDLEDVVGLHPSIDVRASLPDNPQLQSLASVMSWWTILIEGFIAASFLAPKPAWLSRWRDWALIWFIAATYSIVPVLGFGYMLVILGFVSCPADRKFARIGYLTVLAVLELSRLLRWDSILDWLLSILFFWRTDAAILLPPGL